MTLSDRIATARKAVVALVGVLSSLLTANLLPGNVAVLVSSVVGVATVVLTYWVPNDPAGGKHEAAA